MDSDERDAAAGPDEAAGELRIDEISVGANAHGYGRTADGREFAFRVRGSGALVEVYRLDSAVPMPVPEDVEETSQRSVGEVDLHDERSLTALVRDMVADASPAQGRVETTVKAFLSRLGSVMDSL